MSDIDVFVNAAPIQVEVEAAPVEVSVSAAQGPGGNTILSGVVDPTTEGSNGDFYLNTATTTLFGPKAGGVWPAGVPLLPILTDYVPYTGATTDVNLGAQELTTTGGVNSNHIDLTGSNPADIEGRIYYDSTEGEFIAIDDITGTALSINHEGTYRVKNETGVLIPNGSVVYINGNVVGTKKATVALAQATSAKKSDVLGVVTADIADNAEGKVTCFGYVNGINLAGLANGAALYLSPTVAGALTEIRPSRPDWIVEVGQVTKTGASGSLAVSITKDNGSLMPGAVVAADITNFDTEVSNNTDVAANTAARHVALTVTDSAEIDFTLTGQDLTASIIAGSIDETKLDTSTNASLDRGDQASDMLSTGSISGGVISINADPVKFDISAGSGIIVDSTTSPPTVTEVSWGAFTAQTVTNLATSFATDLAINAAGAIVQQNSFSDEEVRSLIILGGLDHSNQTSILNTFQIAAPVKSVASGLRELSRAIGDLNLDGNIYSANGANLNINKSSGKVFSYGRNVTVNVDAPHVIDTPIDTAVSFGRVFNNGSGVGTFTAPSANLDPENYDNGTGTLAGVPVNDWTIQRVLFFPNANKTFVQYGVDTYNRLNDALDAVPRAQFLALSGIKTAMIRGYIIVQQGETDLTNATFLSADRLGNVASSSSGINSTLADLTDVSITSVAPGEIIQWSGTEWVNQTLVEAGIVTTDGVEVLTNKTIDSDLNTITNIVDADVKADAKINASKIAMARIAGSTYYTLQHWRNNLNSTGLVAGGDVVDDGDGTISVSAGSVVIRATNDVHADLLSADFPAEAGANVALVDNALSFVYVEYNAGVPQVVASTVKPTDLQTNVLLSTAFRTGTVLHTTLGQRIDSSDPIRKLTTRFQETQPFQRVSGGVISETGTRNIALTAGEWWEGLYEFTTAAKDTSVSDTFAYYYRDGLGGFTEVAASTQIDNLQYDDGTGTLATLGNSRYANHWVYLGQDGDIYVVYGRGSYILADAQDASPPPEVPGLFDLHARLIGKIIIQKSDTVFTSIETAYGMEFAPSLATDHGGLIGLADDDHLQYHTDARGDARYYTQAQSDAAYAAIAHTHPASDITDFDTEVSNNTDVAANTAARHAALTVTDSAEIDFTLTGQDLTASIIAGSIDETKLDTSTNASLDLADSSVQPGDDADTLGSGVATDGQVLTADGIGGAAWEDAAAGGSSRFEVKTASFTAAVAGSYLITASATITDPSTPTDGEAFVFFVEGGTTTTGAGTHTAGAYVIRSYDGATWSDTTYKPASADASQAEMEAGTETALRRMSPLRVAQAISAQAASGDCVLITSGAAVAAASLDFTGLSTTYFKYMLVLTDVYSSTNATTLLVRTSTDNGTSFNSGANDYDSNVVEFVSGTNVNNDQGTNAIKLVRTGQLSSDSTETLAGSLHIGNPADSGEQTIMHFHGGADKADGNWSQVVGAGRRVTAEANDAIQVVCAAGNITCSYALYGFTS